MSHGITVGSTNAFMYFRAYNTDNTALLTLTSATTALALNVYRAGSTDVAISSLTDKSDPDDAHSDGAIYQIGGSNLYSIDVPDAAVATQVPSVIIEGSFTGGFIDGIPHPINGYDATAVAVGANVVVPMLGTLSQTEHDATQTAVAAVAASTITALGTGTEVFGHSYLTSFKRIEIASGNATLTGAGTGTEVLTSEDSVMSGTYTVDNSGNISAIVWA